jgi:hypothetical protein
MQESTNVIISRVEAQKIRNNEDEIKRHVDYLENLMKAYLELNNKRASLMTMYGRVTARKKSYDFLPTYFEMDKILALDENEGLNRDKSETFLSSVQEELEKRGYKYKGSHRQILFDLKEEDENPVTMLYRSMVGNKMEDAIMFINHKIKGAAIDKKAFAVISFGEEAKDGSFPRFTPREILQLKKKFRESGFSEADNLLQLSYDAYSSGYFKVNLSKEIEMEFEEEDEIAE